jgi:hypothetical protein
MAIVFAVQFVALIGQVMAPPSSDLTSPHLIASHHLISSRLIVAPAGQMNAPIEKSFRKLTLSFSWANLQFKMPSFGYELIAWATGDPNIDGKLSYGFSNPVPAESLPADYNPHLPPPNILNGQEELLVCSRARPSQ